MRVFSKSQIITINLHAEQAVHSPVSRMPLGMPSLESWVAPATAAGAPALLSCVSIHNLPHETSLEFEGELVRFAAHLTIDCDMRHLTAYQRHNAELQLVYFVMRHSGLYAHAACVTVTQPPRSESAMVQLIRGTSSDLVIGGHTVGDLSDLALMRNHSAVALAVDVHSARGANSARVWFATAQIKAGEWGAYMGALVVLCGRASWIKNLVIRIDMADYSACAANAATAEMYITRLELYAAHLDVRLCVQRM